MSEDGGMVCGNCGATEDKGHYDGCEWAERHPTEGLPPDLARILRDPSIIVPQDQAVFELVAKWMDAPCDTASAMTVDDWRRAWELTRQDAERIRKRLHECRADFHAKTIALQKELAGTRRMRDALHDALADVMSAIEYEQMIGDADGTLSSAMEKAEELLAAYAERPGPDWKAIP